MNKLPINLLLVEDSSVLVLWMTEIFSEIIENFNVAVNGIQGLELYHKLKPDLIITDIQMPEMNGLDMVGHIRKVDNNVKIIIVSAYNQSNFFLEALNHGVDGFLLKPIMTDNLLEIIYKISKIILNEKELKEKTFQLTESEKKFRTYIEYAPDGIFVFDEKGKIIDFNNAALNLTCLKPEQLTNPVPTDKFGVNDLFNPHIFSQMIAVSKFSDEYIFTHCSVNWKCIAIDIVKINDSKYIGYCKDITERKINEQKIRESEDKYRSLFENNQLSVGIGTMDGFIVEVNESLCNLFGYSYSELTNKFEIKKLYANQQQRTEIIHELKSKGRIKDKEIEFRRKDGTLIYGCINITNINLNSRQCIMTTIYDITERKQTERRILNAIIETEEKERSHFAQELHDGLGPVLSTTKMYLQALADSTAKDQIHFITDKVHHTIDEAIQSLTEISNNISPHILRNFGLISAIRSFTDKLKETRNINVIFKSNFNEKLFELIEITLYRVVIELIHNTIKYAKAQNITINLTKNKEKIFLEYTDDGKGFDVTKVYKLKKGMGLFNIKNRIQTFKGSFDISSQPAKGVRITIEIDISGFRYSKTN